MEREYKEMLRFLGYNSDVLLSVSRHGGRPVTPGAGLVAMMQVAVGIVLNVWPPIYFAIGLLCAAKGFLRWP